MAGKGGRPQKLGNVVCLTPECAGYLALGRFRMKWTRGKPTARYIGHWYFRHNDYSIGEHYVKKKYLPKKSPTAIALDKVDSFIKKMEHGFNRIFEDSKKFPLEREVKRRWLIANIKLQKDLIMPLKLIQLDLTYRHISEITGESLPKPIQKLHNEIKQIDIGKSLQIIREKHPYFQELDYLHVKYQNVVISDKRKKQAKSWHNSQDIPKSTLPSLNDLLSSVQEMQP